MICNILGWAIFNVKQESQNLRSWYRHLVNLLPQKPRKALILYNLRRVSPIVLKECNNLQLFKSLSFGAFRIFSPQLNIPQTSSALQANNSSNKQNHQDKMGKKAWSGQTMQNKVRPDKVR